MTEIFEVLKLCMLKAKYHIHIKRLLYDNNIDVLLKSQLWNITCITGYYKQFQQMSMSGSTTLTSSYINNN